jgi:molybdopterin converting factor small subunit
METVATTTVKVGIPAALRDRTSGRRWVTASGGTVRDVIASLESDYPGLGFNLCYETGELREFVNVFVGEENARYLQGLDTPISAGQTVHFIHSVAGG